MSNQRNSKQPDTTEKLMDHAYDGIQELDNPLPKWWLYGFYMCIVFSGVYFAYYQMGPGPSLISVYDERVAALKASRKEDTGGFQNELLEKMHGDHAFQTMAATMFAEKCAACHGGEGQGIIGPNLTDAYWIHGGKPNQILKTITTGVGDKGMPAWGEQLKPDEVQMMAAYVMSLKDTHPANPKEPQGNLVKESDADTEHHHEDHK
jgi:cytochrome c oxidase cbb3-type subunit 3